MMVVTVVAIVLLVLVLLGWWLSWTATRMDRLHARVESSRAELDTQLVRRCSVAATLARLGLLDPASAVLLAQAAHEAGEEDDHQQWRKDAQTRLTQALHAALEQVSVDALREDPVAVGVLDDLTSTCQRVVYARRIHNDAVSAALRLRHVRRVRWFSLAGHADLPHTCLMQDDVPPALLESKQSEREAALSSHGGQEGSAPRD